MFFLRLDFWASQYIIQFKSQNASLNNSGKQLSSVSICEVSPNFCNVCDHLSPLTRLSQIARSQTLARANICWYYLYITTYIINLNFIIYLFSPGFELGSPGPKSTNSTIVLCTIFQVSHHLTFISLFQHIYAAAKTWLCEIWSMACLIWLLLDQRAIYRSHC